MTNEVDSPKTLDQVDIEDYESRIKYFESQPELKALVDPLLFKNVTEIELDKTIVREEEARKTIFLVCAGGRLVKNAEPTSKNLMINDLSGAGKDYIIKQVLGLIEDDYKIIRKRISQRAFTYWKNAYHNPNWTWDGKIFYNEDISNSVLNSDVFKVMASSDGENISTMVINQVAYDIKVVGKPVMLITIAHANPKNENLRRFPICNIDTSEEQTKLIIKKQAEYHKTGKKLSYDPNLIYVLGKLTRINVIVPYADKLVELFNTTNVIVRTNFNRFVDYIKFSTAIHQYRREINDDSFFIADGQDYDIGRAAFLKTTSNVYSIPLTKKQQEILNIFLKLKNEHPNLYWSAPELEKYFSFSQRTLYKYLDELFENGFLEKDKQEREGVSKPVAVYRYIDVANINLPTWKELQKNLN